jgi:hypothetical protein
MIIIYKKSIKLLIYTGLKIAIKKRFLHSPLNIAIELSKIKRNYFSFNNCLNIKMKQQSLM